MDSSEGVEPTAVSHVVAMPFPGRGHINPMMNFCKFLASRNPELLITFVITEEWLGFIGSDTKPKNIRYATIPNVIPAERLKAADFPGFYEAVMTKMETPFDQLLDRLDPPVTTIVADVEVLWGTRIENRRNIPIALFWTMSASFFSIMHFCNLFAEKKKNFPLDYLVEREGEQITGISSGQLGDLQTVFRENDQKVLELALKCISQVTKAQYLLLTSVYELEPQAMETLQAELHFPVYPIGPAIPYISTNDDENNYLPWLNSQPKGSVLYISLGSFLSVSSAQMDEIASGLCLSDVRFLWVARAEASKLQKSCGQKGLVVSWCDQLKVLRHPSVSGFWTHCGWNSVLEAVFAGVSMLTFPLFLDQVPNSRQIVEDWKIGKWVSKEMKSRNFMKREEVAEIVKGFLDLESDEGKEMRKRGKELRDLCHQAIEKGGSSDRNLDVFLKDIKRHHQCSQAPD